VSVRLALLNLGLRLIERPHLARASPEDLRASFEFKAKWLFLPPRGTERKAITLGGLSALSVSGPWSEENRVLLYFHGGGYVFGSPDTHSALVARLARKAGARAVMPRYRRAPEHPFPAAWEDAVAAWDNLLVSGIPPETIILGGDSAGGGLALSLLGTLVERGGSLPRAAFAFSPLTDLTFSGPSIIENAASEAMLPVERCLEMQSLYLAGHAPDDPRVSPLKAQYSPDVPVWLCVGDTEILRDDTTRLADKLKAQGVEAKMELGHKLPHVWPFFAPLLPDANRTLADLADWLRRQWSQGGN
jgi:acetyl esterase/lipase